MATAGDLSTSEPKTQDYPWLGWIILVLILVVGAYFRFTGLNWDASQHLHPDERFLTMVESSLQPVGLGQFFDTEHSTLNPNNVGYGFFVYGTLPIFIVRYLAEAVHQTGYDQVFLVGRASSAAVDTLAVLLVYMIAQRMFRRRWLSLIAAAFYAFAVLPIQLSHYFAVDTFTNTFGLISFYCMAVILTAKPLQLAQVDTPSGSWFWLRQGWSNVWPYLGFGAAYGAALASKISIVPLAVLLPGAGFIVWTRLSPEERNRQWGVILRNLVLAGILAFIVFRIGQPYAFKGPSFFGIIPNQQWIDNLRTLQAQSNGDSDSPPELQWARRPISFALTNLVDWGVGLPLGLLAVAGFLWMGWRILRGGWREYSLIWLWTGAYFLWQGLSFTRTMRYEIPIYPMLAIIAAWMVIEMWDGLQSWFSRLGARLARVPWGKILAALAGAAALTATFLWAFAFTRIYTRPMTRVEASQWIYQNVPGPVNLQIQTPQGQVSRPLSYPNDSSFTNGQGIQMAFTAQSDGAASELDLPSVNLTMVGAGSAQLIAELINPADNNQTLATGIQVVTESLQQKPVAIAFDHAAMLKKGTRYALKVNLGGILGTVSLQSDLVLKVFNKTTQISLDAKNVTIQPEQAYTVRFTSKVNGPLRQVSLPVVMPKGTAPIQAAFSVSIIDSTGKLLGNTNPILELTPGIGASLIQFDPAIQLTSGISYLITVDELNAGQPIQLNGSVMLNILDDSQNQVLPAPTHLIQPNAPFQTPFTAQTSGMLSAVKLAWASQQDPSARGADDLTVVVSDVTNTTVLGKAIAHVDLETGADPRGVPVLLTFDPPIAVENGTTYFMQLAPAKGSLAIRGSAPANESSWDDGLPLRVDGLDGYNGIYTSGLNFEMYWDDNAAKLDRFVSTLNSADYIFISSNRQWATTTRVQERYPLTTEYYRALSGCPADQSIVWCYSVVQPGMWNGQLGFTLVKTFQSEPALGSWTFNSQFAEEAFTVYDHPKVLIFKKDPTYSTQKVEDLLGAVDLSKVIHVTPRKAGVPGNLMLPSELWAQQQEGGTWADLFNRLAVTNQYPGIGAIVWYLFFLLLGWMMYPLVRLALGGLADHGYPLARVTGMVLLAFFVWLGGSSGIPFTRPMIWLVLAGLLVVNAVLFLLQRGDIIREIKQQPRYYLMIEALFLIFFLIDLGIRFGNPDLWHPAKGGEKPMDFSYLNAVIKSTSFPPYDPWFAGGYINYYYYGFVLIGVPIKALGIMPEIAYNLALPMLFAMVALGAFSVGWNLLSHRRADEEEPPLLRWLKVERRPFLAGFAAALGMLILGNLGTINMIWEGFQLLVVSQDVMQKGDLLARFGWMFQGMVKFIGGMQFPYNIGEWYWNPSRVIPGEPITEFPNFTFLYADPHAHMIALPVTLLSLSWAISIVRAKWQWAAGRSQAWSWLQFAFTFALGGITIGALRPTNTWDMPVYLVLGILAILYAVLRYAQPPQCLIILLDRMRLFVAEMDEETEVSSLAESKWAGWVLKFFTLALPAVLLLVTLAFVFYQPYANWYGQGYNALDPWTGDHTPMWSYRMQWGVFLFIIASWMVWETIDWMANTPVSAINKLRPYLFFIGGALLALIAAIIFLTVNNIAIAWVPLLLGAWAVVLILRPGQPDDKRIVLFMVGSALILTLAVEVIVLRGDLGRMNTVFKFYLQAWTLFSLSAAAALIWLMPAALRWVRRSNWGVVWQFVLIFLIGSAALFPLLAGRAKVEDRMSNETPHTLDGMAYMVTSQYGDQDVTMNLSADYMAIQWMQNAVKGSPVIVEANTSEYRWGTRFTIYTGLPGVAGWSWHQRQQRAITPPEWVTGRIDQIGTFYTTSDETFVKDFLRQYNVSYIIVGQLEKAYYHTGLDKFSRWNGKYWNEVYHDGDTAIYQVLK
jgi:YYY domain-containing protein